jgi:hypothetical protein
MKNKKTRRTTSRKLALAANESRTVYVAPQTSATSKAVIPGTAISPRRIEYYMRTRFEPIKDLTPERLTTQLWEFTVGHLRTVSQTFEAIQNRCDILKCVIPKRIGAVTRLSWEVCIDATAQDDPQAEAHKEALEYFYRNLEATNSVDNNHRGGFSLLVKQMMDAVAKKYAIHQIIWIPENGQYTARFNFIPLWFFENTIGRLRFLPDEGALYGVDPQFEMMVTVGAGLMEACAVCYMFKKMTFADWMVYMERHGQPAFAYKTAAVPNTPEHDAAKEFVAELASSFAGVMGPEDELIVSQLSATGQLPYPVLVERMDRALAALWRGADLSTISAGSGQGQGASLQATEETNMQSDDAALISETLNIQVDRKVIAMKFGEGVRPLAYIKLKVPKAINVDQEMKVDKHLREFKIPLSAKDVLERFDRAPAQDGDDLVPEPEPEPAAGEIRFGANEREMKTFLRNANSDLAKRNAPALKKITERVEGLLSLDGDQFLAGLKNFRRDRTKLLAEVNKEPGAREAIEETIIGAYLNGKAQTIVDTTRRTS